MMCVCRGKVAEGIDLPGERIRAVIVVGVPYPPGFSFHKFIILLKTFQNLVKEKKVQLKREYLD